jgi:hypothetical protein
MMLVFFVFRARILVDGVLCHDNNRCQRAVEFSIKYFTHSVTVKMSVPRMLLTCFRATTYLTHFHLQCNHSDVGLCLSFEETLIGLDVAILLGEEITPLQGDIPR